MGGPLCDPYSIERPGSITLVGDLSGDSGEFRCDVRTNPTLPNGNAGIVFGFSDTDNYYRLRIPVGKDYCELVRKKEGRYHVLYRGALKLRRDRWRPIVFRYEGNKALVEVEHRTIGIENYNPAGHGAGLYVWGNDNARFTNLRLGPLTETNPRLVLLSPLPGQISSEPQINIRAMTFGRFTGEPWVRFELDPRGDQPQSVFKGNPLEVSFARINPGEHSLEVHLLIGGATMEQTVISPIGIGEEWVAIGEDAVWGTGDDVPGDDISRDERNLFGGFTPILGDWAAQSLGRPVWVACEGMPGAVSKDGWDRLETILARHPRASRYFLLFGTNDLSNAHRTPSGLGVVDATGTFRHHLSGMIQRIQAKGASVLLGKVPYIDAGKVAGGIYSASDPLLLEYNKVIDELTLAHGLPGPPDFYSLFKNNPSLLADGAHPNGKGYQEMARKWLEAVR